MRKNFHLSRSEKTWRKLISQGFDPVHLRTYIVYLETIWCIKLKYDYDKFQERDDVYRTFSFDSYKFMYDLYYKPSVVLRRRFGKTKLIYS